MPKWYKHLKTINRHKKMVRKYCFKLGLYKQGLLHDLSKYSWAEFSMGAKYFQGNRSPNDAEREDKGYTSAWLHHKGRNKHHYEYWIDHSVDKTQGMIGMKMPTKYVVEMLCDRIAASKNYNRDSYTDRLPLDYYNRGKAGQYMHPETRKLLVDLLTMLAEQGEEYTFAYIRSDILKNKKKFD